MKTTSHLKMNNIRNW